MFNSLSSNIFKKIKGLIVISTFFGFGFLLAFLLFSTAEDAPREEPYILPIEFMTEDFFRRDLNVGDWLTYTSEEYNFSISYPQDTQFNEQGIYPPPCFDEHGLIENCKEEIDATGILKRYFINSEVSPQNLSGYPYNVNIILSIYQKDVSLGEWIEEKYHNSFFCGPVSINAVVGLICSDTKDFSPKSYSGFFKKFFLKHNDLIYSFEPEDVFSGDLLNQNHIYEAIISTFRI